MRIDKMITKRKCFDLLSNFLNELFNPLSPNSDQHQFSPNDIHTLSRD